MGFGLQADNYNQSLSPPQRPEGWIHATSRRSTVRLYLYVTAPDGQTGSAYVNNYIFSPVCW